MQKEDYKVLKENIQSTNLHPSVETNSKHDISNGSRKLNIMNGVAYPPDGISNSGDKFPTQESLELEDDEVKTGTRKATESESSSSIEKISVSKDSVGSNYIFGDDLLRDKSAPNLEHQVSTNANFGSSSVTRTCSGSLNLMEFPSAISSDTKCSSNVSQEIYIPPVFAGQKVRFVLYI